MNTPLFRKESLDRLGSRDELDRLLVVTTPLGWYSLVATGLVILAALLWGVFGSIPRTTEGKGIFINKGGVYEIVSETTGQVYDFRLRPGDTVDKGQVVARVRQPELEKQAESSRKELGNLREQLRLLQGQLDVGSLQQTRFTELQAETYRKRMEDKTREIAWLKQKLLSQEELNRNGVIALTEVMTTRKELDEAKSDIRQFQSQINQLSLDKTNSQIGNREKLLQYEKQIREGELALASLEARLERNAVIRSHISGQVLSTMVHDGTVVQVNTPLINISLAGEDSDDLEAVVYVTAAEAKLIRNGMQVQVSPVQAKKDEYGYMVGTVQSVSRFPARPEEIMNQLHNPTLVKELTDSGAPLRVLVELLPDASEAKGYQWSTKRGGIVTIDEGTRCNATFIVRELRPISLVIPLFRRYVYGL